MNDLDLPTFSSLRGSRSRPPVTPHSRSYGKAKDVYTPLQTNLDPRTPYRNDVVPIESDVIAVVLQNGSVALVDTGDYQHLRTMGYLGRWTAKPVSGGNTYVAVNHGRHIITVARLVLAANRSESVRYSDGNPLNLVRRNLILCTSGGMPIRNQESRRCAQAPSVEHRWRKDHRMQDAGAAVVATRIAIDKASPSIAAARASRTASLKSVPSRFAPGDWVRHLIAKPSIDTCAAGR